MDKSELIAILDNMDIKNIEFIKLIYNGGENQIVFEMEEL